MKFKYLIKVIPFLSTLFFIIFLFFSNQKVNTKLRILIWNTPSYSLGTYLAISAGSGFIISYILTANLANIYKSTAGKSLNYRIHKSDEEVDEDKHSSIGESFEKILIERDVNNPSPTINAQFRVIGKTERYNTNYVNYNIQYDNTSEFVDPAVEQYKQDETVYQEKQTLSDWNDDSYTKR